MVNELKNKKKMELRYAGDLVNLKKILLTIAIQLINCYTYVQLSPTHEYLNQKYGSRIPIIVDRNWIPDKKRSSGNFMESLSASNFFNFVIAGYPKTTRALGIIAPIIATQMELDQENTDLWDIFAYWAGFLAMIGMDITLLRAVKNKTYRKIVDKLIEENQNNEIQALTQICKEIRALNNEAEKLKWNQYDSKNLKINLTTLLTFRNLIKIEKCFTTVVYVYQSNIKVISTSFR